MYGAFKIGNENTNWKIWVGVVGGCHTAPSSETFDQMLKSMNPEYGVRNLDDVIDIAKSHGMEFVAKVPMPANNFVIIFEKTWESGQFNEVLCSFFR